MKFVRVSDVGRRTVAVPAHREIVIGTIRGILRQAGVTPEDFEKL